MATGQGEYGDEPEGPGDGGDEMGCGPSVRDNIQRRNAGYGDLWEDVHSGHRFWVNLDALGFSAKGNPLPPLVTTSPAGTPQAEAGVLGQSGTSILFGNQSVDSEMRTGGHIELGYWIVDGEFVGVMGHYLILGDQSTDKLFTSSFANGAAGTILARPFFNAVTGLQDSALVAFPNYNLNGTPVDLSGTVQIHTTSNIQSAGALLRNLLWIDFDSKSRIDILSGYRFFRLDDSVAIDDSFNTSGGVLAPTTFTSHDQFGAINQFNGGEFGVLGQIYRGRWSVELLGKIAFGANSESVSIGGSNSITTLGSTVTSVGGLLTQPTNIGHYERDVFAVLPEGGVKLKYDLTHNVRLTAGYDIMYLNRVLRSGDQIDLGLNPTQINGGTLMGPARPAFAFNGTDFWAQGVSLGMEFRY
jgi:hypothetical protein